MFTIVPKFCSYICHTFHDMHLFMQHKIILLSTHSIDADLNVIFYCYSNDTLLRLYNLRFSWINLIVCCVLGICICFWYEFSAASLSISPISMWKGAIQNRFTIAVFKFGWLFTEVDVCLYDAPVFLPCTFLRIQPKFSCLDIWSIDIAATGTIIIWLLSLLKPVSLLIQKP